MFNPKNLATSAAVGFVLSFLICVVSTHKFGVALLRGCIFALVFAALDFAIEFVYAQFLDDSQGSDSLEEKKPAQKSAGRSGSLVDITIDDENLTEDDQAPSFAVSANASGSVPYGKPPVIEDSPVVSSEPAVTAGAAPVQNSVSAPDAPVAEKSEFKPVQLGQKIENVTPVNSTPEPASTSRKAQAAAEREASMREIDSLPDIGGISDDSGSASEPEVIDNSEFAREGQSVSAPSPLVDSSDVVKQDTKIIASAIRTILKKDE